MSSIPGMIQILAVDDHALLHKGVTANHEKQVSMRSQQGGAL